MVPGQTPPVEHDVLCSRCRSSPQDTYVYVKEGSQSSTNWWRKQIFVEPESLKPNCALCLLLTRFLQDGNNTSRPEDAGYSGPSTPTVGPASETGTTAIGNIFYSCISIRLDERGDYVDLLPVNVPMFLPSRHIPKKIKDSADLECAKQWMMTCRKSHGMKCCRKAPARHSKTALKVIDCFTKQVREAGPKESYVALSYVWGNALGGSTSRSLMDAPKTVTDAMFVAVQIGIPRLWVDLYCIDQNDHAAKGDAIASMHLIYGGAKVTIVAASGTNASSGLAGICGTPRLRQKSVQIGNYTYIQEEDIDARVEHSRWNTRGWTFQEGLLSTRLLLFTDSQLYFQCGAMHCLEEHTAAYPNQEISNLERHEQVFPSFGIGVSVYDAHQRIREYFPRQLSYRSDALHAIEGILEAFEDTPFVNPRAKHFYGVPVIYERSHQLGESVHVTSNLLWRVVRTNSLAAPSTYKTSTDAELPSWSWTSRMAMRPSTTDKLVFDYLPWELASGSKVEYGITHQSGDVVDFLQFATALRGAKYSEFWPWIDVTTWTIQGYVSENSATDFNVRPTLNFLGIPEAGVHLDGDNWDGGVTTAVFLGFVGHNKRPIFLLVREAGVRGTFSRVGLWTLPHFPVFGSDVLEILEKSLKANGAGCEALLERQTVRLV
ncbi:HET-domain-containing protein [Decorospora gaudefroyi]|uniref:HET-domain-containing protein n=1 Tax=Decorospora gaudefroyi TaxID=184978 RepID=A0A6A5KE87_9PLEO|nr:HET-domain-containing protein [Decorospora gaudefroyi]